MFTLCLSYNNNKLFICINLQLLIIMCGRTSLSLNKDQIQCACSWKPRNGEKYVQPKWLPEHNDGKEFKPSHNIAPTDVTPVLMPHATNNMTMERVLKPMMWGIIPPWHKGNYKNHRLSTNNCRLENIRESKLYSPILNNGGRCIIIAEGFYEWQTTDKKAKNKQPYYIYSQQSEDVKMDDPKTWNNSYNEDTGWTGIRLLHMAGVYNIWQDEGTIIYSYSVITMESNNTLSWLHHRMPAILNTEEQIEAWLNINDVSGDMALAYLKPVKILSWHAVSTAVNNSRNKSEECNKKVIIATGSKQKTLNNWFTQTNKRKMENSDNSNSKKICK